MNAEKALELTIPINIVFILLFFINFVTIHLINWWARAIMSEDGDGMTFFIIAIVAYIAINLAIINNLLTT
jgi:hypothetical protein